MTHDKTGGPAFPPMHDPATHASGMTLRDYAAIHAPEMPEQWWQDTLHDKREKASYAEALAAWGYHYADAMIAARGDT